MMDRIREDARMARNADYPTDGLNDIQMPTCGVVEEAADGAQKPC